MPPSNEDPDCQKAHDDAANPFISFRRFADEQMSYLMQNVFGLSSSSSPDRRMQDYQTWLQEARESRDRLDRETEEADRIMDLYSRAHKEGQDPAQEEIQRAIQGDFGEMRCPYRPNDQSMPTEPFRQNPWDRERSRISAQAAFGTPLHREIYDAFGTSQLIPQQAFMPMAYLLYSPYSPVKLEQQEALRDHSIDWREAFEDLVAVQKGQDMPIDSSHRPFESSSEWVKSITGMLTGERKDTKQESDGTLEALREKTAEVIRDIPNLCFMFCDPDRAEKVAAEANQGGNLEPDDEEEEEFTELDVYDRFLGREQAPSAKATARSFAQLQHDTGLTQTDGKKPSILSTLTTTERTALQDGTVHTKTVLKKRFTDGREVETETVHTQNVFPQGYSQQPFRKIDDSQGRERQEQKAKGWFWS